MLLELLDQELGIKVRDLGWARGVEAADWRGNGGGDGADGDRAGTQCCLSASAAAFDNLPRARAAPARDVVG